MSSSTYPFFIVVSDAEFANEKLLDTIEVPHVFPVCPISIIITDPDCQDFRFEIDSLSLRESFPPRLRSEERLPTAAGLSNRLPTCSRRFLHIPELSKYGRALNSPLCQYCGPDSDPKVVPPMSREQAVARWRIRKQQLREEEAASNNLCLSIPCQDTWVDAMETDNDSTNEDIDLTQTLSDLVDDFLASGADSDMIDFVNIDEIFGFSTSGEEDEESDDSDDDDVSSCYSDDEECEMRFEFGFDCSDSEDEDSDSDDTDDDDDFLAMDLDICYDADDEFRQR